MSDKEGFLTEVILWGPPVVPSGPLDQKFRDDIEEWIQKCANVGVNRIIGGDRTRVPTEVAGIHGIDVHPYVNFNSFPRHGSARESYGWSLAFLRPPVTAPLRPDHIGMRISVAGFNTEEEVRHLASSIQDGVKLGK